MAPTKVSWVAGLWIPPATGRPSSTNPTDTQNSGIPFTNSRVPSRGSTTQTRFFSRRPRSSTLSSESPQMVEYVRPEPGVFRPAAPALIHELPPPGRDAGGLRDQPAGLGELPLVVAIPGHGDRD